MLELLPKIFCAQSLIFSFEIADAYGLMIQISMLKSEFSTYLQCWVCVKY